MILDEFRKFLLPHLWAQDEPSSRAPLQYDAEFGFDHERPLKKPKATEEEMSSIHLEQEARDECAHLHIEFRSCMRENIPIWWKCNGYKNELKHCYYMEKIHDMKEYEREKRLNRRERKLQSQS